MITLAITTTLAFGIAASVHKILMRIIETSEVGLETKPKPEFN